MQTSDRQSGDGMVQEVLLDGAPMQPNAEGEYVGPSSRVTYRVTVSFGGVVDTHSMMPGGVRPLPPRFKHDVVASPPGTPFAARRIGGVLFLDIKEQPATTTDCGSTTTPPSPPPPPPPPGSPPPPPAPPSPPTVPPPGFPDPFLPPVPGPVPTIPPGWVNPLNGGTVQ